MKDYITNVTSVSSDRKPNNNSETFQIPVSTLALSFAYRKAGQHISRNLNDSCQDTGRSQGEVGGLKREVLPTGVPGEVRAGCHCSLLSLP